MTITLISVLVALVIGGLETLGILESALNLRGGFWDFIAASTSDGNFGWVGAGIIAIFLLSWIISTVIYRINRYDSLELTLASASLGDRTDERDLAGATVQAESHDGDMATWETAEAS
jgi:high-affinity nickel-transport protein